MLAAHVSTSLGASHLTSSPYRSAVLNKVTSPGTKSPAVVPMVPPSHHYTPKMTKVNVFLYLLFISLATNSWFIKNRQRGGAWVK